MKNATFLAVTTAIAVAGGAMIYLSQTIFKYNSIKNNFPSLNTKIEAYPYTNTDTPDDFKGFSVNGISFKAPDTLSPSQYDEKISILTDDPDKDKASLQMIVTDITRPVYPKGFDLKKDDIFNSGMKQGMDKLGYDVPDNFYDLILMLNSIDLDDCNKFSPTEVRTFKKLAEFKELMTLPVMGYGDKNNRYEQDEQRYYFDNNETSFFVTQLSSSNGMYKLILDCYAKNDLDEYQTLLIQGKNMETVRQIVMTVSKTE